LPKSLADFVGGELSPLAPHAANRYIFAMIIETIPGVSQLTVAEKLLLVSELWDDLAAHPAEVPVSREQIVELDRRLEAYHRDPSQATSWEAIQQRILGKKLGGE
jgi:putative addiction module component (TIGR02574 family)